MKKLTAFGVAFIMAGIYCLLFFLLHFNKFFDANMNTFLIFWYMLWKLFHDKNKD